jgi:hypothetical protein
MSPWQATPARDSKAGRYGLPVLDFGYGRQARDHGFAVQPLPSNGVIDMRGAHCPTLVWTEHVLSGGYSRVRDLLTRADLHVIGLRPGQRLRLLQRRASKILVVPAPGA